MIKLITTTLLLFAVVIGQSEAEPDSSLEKSRAAEPSSLLESRANLQNLNNTTTNGASGTIRTFDNRRREVEGSPYLFSDTRSATVVLVDGQILTGPARYNAYNNTVEFFQGNTEIKVLAGQIRALKFDIGNEGVPLALEQRQLPLGGIQPLPAFLYEPLYSGEIELLKRHAKEFKKGMRPAMHHVSSLTDEYLDKPQYYLRAAGSEKFQIIQLRKSAILKALGDAQAEAKAYIKSQKLDCGEPSDVVRLLEYVESLGNSSDE